MISNLLVASESACLPVSVSISSVYFSICFVSVSMCVRVSLFPPPPPHSLSLSRSLSSLYLSISLTLSLALSPSLNIINPGNNSCHTAPSRFVFNLIQYLFAQKKKRKFVFDFLTCYFSIRDISFDELHRSLPSKWLIDFELAILTHQH